MAQPLRKESGIRDGRTWANLVCSVFLKERSIRGRARTGMQYMPNKWLFCKLSTIRGCRMLKVKLAMEQMDDNLKAMRKPKRAPEPFLTKMLKKHGLLDKDN